MRYIEKIKSPSIRRAQLDTRAYHRGRLGSVTHIFIFEPGWELEWNTLCGRLTRAKDKTLKDNNHLRLCVDCQNRLNLMNDLMTVDTQSQNLNGLKN